MAWVTDVAGNKQWIQEVTEPADLMGFNEKIKDFAGVVDGGGAKFGNRDDKNRLSLVPPLFIKILGWVFTYGAKKYADGNWMRGIKYSEVYEASMRHLLDFWDGMDTDKESGLEHLAHAFWGIGVLYYYAAHSEYAQFDDRVFSEGDGGTAKVVGTTKMGLAPDPVDSKYSTTPQHHASLLMFDEVPTAPNLTEMLLEKYPELKHHIATALDPIASSKDRSYSWEMIEMRFREELKDGAKARRLAEDVDSCEKGDGTSGSFPPMVRPECDSGGRSP